MMHSVKATRSNSDPALAEDLAQAKPKKTEQSEMQPSYAKPINAFCAEAAGFFTRILVERTCFQNTHIPKEVWLYLGNDLIKTLSAESKESTFSTAKEVSLLWKEFKGVPLTRQERVYLNTPQQLDVLGEVLNGVKCATTFVIGQAWYSSITSAMENRLWSHIPAICAYTGTTLLGGQAVAFAVQQVLNRTDLSDDDKQIVAPWLNMVGRLATGFVPKVHATEEGVHYHYPSMEGHTRTVAPDQTVTMRGDDLTVEKSGTFSTPEGNFEAVHAANFKLAEMAELSEESVKIQVLTKDGEKVPVEFMLVQGLYGPEVTVHSENQELERHWSQYFTKRLPGQPLSDVVLSAAENFPNLFHIESKAIAVCCALIGVAANPRQRSTLVPLTATLFAASLPSPVSAGLFKKIKSIFTSPARNAAKDIGNQAQVALDRFDGIIKASIKEIKELEDEIMIDLDNLGKIFIKDAGEEIGVRVEQIEEGTKGIIEIAGVEARFTAAAVNEEVRVTVREVRKEVEEFLDEFEQIPPRVANNVVTETLKGVRNFFFGESQYERLLNAIQIKMSQGAERTHRERMKNLLKFVQEQASQDISPSEKASLYAELIRHINTPILSAENRKWLMFIISCVASQDQDLIGESSQFFGMTSENQNYFESVVLPVIPHHEIRAAFLNKNFDNLKAEAIESLYDYLEAFPGIDLEKECFFWSEMETASALKEHAYQEICEQPDDAIFSSLHRLLHPEGGKFFNAFLGLAKSEDQEFKRDFVGLVQEFGDQLALEAKHEEARRLYVLEKDLQVEIHGVHSEEEGLALIKIGNTLQGQGDNQAAIKQYNEALEILKCACGELHMNIVEVYGHLGRAYKATYRYEDAETSFEEAKKIVRDLLGSNSHEFASYIEELGHLFVAQSKWQEALEKFQRSLQLYQSVHGEQHPKVADNYQHIGSMFKSLRRFEEAEESFEKAKRIYTDLDGPHSLGVASPFQGLGFVYHDQGNMEKALENFSKSLSLYKTYYGEEHETVANGTGHVGSVLKALGRFDEAVRNFETAKSIFNKIEGPRSLGVARQIEAIGHVRVALGRHPESIVQFEEALEMVQSIFGEMHAAVAGNHQHLGHMYETVGNREASIAHFIKAKEIYSVVTGPNSPEVANQCEQLGHRYVAQERFHDSIVKFEEALAIYRSNFGEMHLAVAGNHRHLGIMYNAIGNREASIAHSILAKDIFSTLLDSNSPEVAEMNQHLRNMGV